MANNTYNGWTNYATWKINLEFGYCDRAEEYQEYEINDLMERIKDETEEIIEEQAEQNSLVLSYALDFISDVNWYEIASNMLENIEE